MVQGGHTLEIEAHDNAGNIGYYFVNFTVDTHVPVVQITAPQDGDLFDRSIHGSVDVAWNVWDNQSGIDRVEVSLDTGAWIETNDTHHIFDGVTDGDHQITVRAYDSAGLYSQAQVHFVIDSTPRW